MRIRMNVASLVAMCLMVVGIWGSRLDEVHGALQGHWNFNETSGTTASDSSGNANTGTLVDGPTWDVGGVFDGAINFDGLNDKVHVPSTAALKYTGGNMTLSTWAYIDAGDTGGNILSKPWNGSGRYNYRIYFSGSTSKSIGFFVGSPTASSPASAAIASAAIPGFGDAWHHIAAVADSSNNTTLYIDGVQAATGSNSIPDYTGSDLNLPLTLGSLYPYGSGWTGNNGFSLDGKLDDTAVWDDDALSQPYVTAIYSLGTEPGLNYDLSKVTQLFDVHTAASGSVEIDDELWYYESDMSGLGLAPGVVTPIGDRYFLLLDSTTGVATPQIPEPSSLLLLGLGALGLVRHTRRIRRA